MALLDLIIGLATEKVVLSLNGAAVAMILVFGYALWWFYRND